MKSRKTLLLSRSIATAFAVAGITATIGTPLAGFAATPNQLGTPNDGMVCRGGYTPNFNGTSLKCSKIDTPNLAVPLTCDDPQFPKYVVRGPAPGTPDGLDVCSRAKSDPAFVDINSTNDISTLKKGKDYVFAKADLAQIALRTAARTQAEATHRPLGQRGRDRGHRAVTNTNAGAATQVECDPDVLHVPGQDRAASSSEGLDPFDAVRPACPSVIEGGVSGRATGPARPGRARAPPPRMQPRSTSFAMFNSRLIAATVAFALAACAAPPKPATLQVQPAAVGPKAVPQRNLTHFADGLRCMDDMLYRFGVRDVSVMIEEMQDQSRRLGAGTRDMMVSAFADMTRKSRGVRLVTFGQDNQNIVQLLSFAQRLNDFKVVPQYDVRGSITQFDEGVSSQQAGLGASLVSAVTGPLFGVRFNRSQQSS